MSLLCTIAPCSLWVSVTHWEQLKTSECQKVRYNTFQSDDFADRIHDSRVCGDRAADEVVDIREVDNHYQVLVASGITNADEAI